MFLRIIIYIKRKIRNLSVNFNTPTKYYKFFPMNYVRYFKYNKSIPLKHVATYEALVNFKRILDSISVDFYLGGGVLLGAYRNNDFAGRPKDVDLWIKNDHLTKVFKNIELLRKNGFYVVKLKVNKGNVNIQSPMGSPITLKPCKKDADGFYRNNKLDEKEIIKLKNDIIISTIPRQKDWDKTYKGMKMGFSSNCRILLYKSFFLIPDNTEQILVKQYGPNWKIPTVRKKV